MNDPRGALTFVQGSIIAVLLAIMVGQVIGPAKLRMRSRDVQPLDRRTATPPIERTWRSMPRD